MTKLLEKALATVRQLSPENQDEIARAMLTLAGDEGEPEEIDPTHLQDVLESLAQAKRRQFATDVEVRSGLPSLRPMKLRFTPRAVENLAQIADYIHERNPRRHFACVSPFMRACKISSCFRRLAGDRTPRGSQVRDA
jgi:hypothetical protein